ncbi:unnamed protein product [Mesocestoides corti]|uniref:Uncharacterized protein n=1 Tax=Mesocestoides corti TaxID=53468 RepID=A0A0R3UFB9_MESCO|nr:unnamed protein product [Mesocestoides corti]
MILTFRDLKDLIERNAQWNENAGEWHLRCVAYAGNNIHRPPEDEGSVLIADDYLPNVYISYKSEGLVKHKKREPKGRKKSDDMLIRDWLVGVSPLITSVCGRGGGGGGRRLAGSHRLVFAKCLINPASESNTPLKCFS